MIDIKVAEDHFIRYELVGSKINVLDVRYERITPGNPTKHFVISPLYSLTLHDGQALSDFLVSVI